MSETAFLPQPARDAVERFPIGLQARIDICKAAGGPGNRWAT